MPSDASRLYARNVQALLTHLAPEGELVLDFEDEITAGACVTRKEAAASVNAGFLIELTVLILAAFLGVQVISKVPTLLHTPLMSGTNAIHGIVIVGAIIVAGHPGQPTWLRIVSLAAVALGTGNVVGGFVVTDRMLRDVQAEEEGAGGRRKTGQARMSRDRLDLPARTWSRSSASSSRSSSSRTRRARGTATWIGAFGMAVAIVATFFTPRPDELRVDPDRDGGRGADRGVRGARREDDRDAGDGGAVQRRRRRRGRARRARGLPQLDPGARPTRATTTRSRSSSPR